MSMYPDITNFNYDSDGNVVSYLEGTDPVILNTDNNGYIATITKGVIGNGTVDVFDYDDQGEILNAFTIPFGYGLNVCGKNIIYNGKKYRGMGVNFFDAITHSDLNARLAELSSYGVPFCRIMMGQYGAGGTSTSEWRLYLTNESQWWANLDTVVNAFENAGIGIIASVFFRSHTLADLMYYKYGKRDTLNQIGNPNSNSRKFMRDYTRKFVTRYANRKGIFAWEFGNEPFSFSQFDTANLPNPIFPPAGSGNTWTYTTNPDPATANGTSDFATMEDVYSGINDFASIVRQNDPYNRIINSGSAFPFANEYHMRIASPSGQLDTQIEWETDPVNGMHPLDIWNPSNCNVYDAHIYQEGNTPFWYWNNLGSNNIKPPGIAKYLADYARGKGKPVILGEFGSLTGTPGQNGNNGTDGTNPGEQNYFNALLNAVITNKIDISCIWNYGLSKTSSASVWNIDPNTSTSAATFIDRSASPPNRDYQLTAIAAANDAIKQLI